MDFLERVGQCAHHGVNRSGVVEPRSPSQAVHPVRRPAHRFGATSHRRLSIAMHNRLRRGEDSLQAATAKPVESQCRSFDWQAPAQCGDPRKIHVLSIGVNYISENDMGNLCRREA
jgi:hypothetical protein